MAVTRVAPGGLAGARERALDRDAARETERALPGVIASLYSVTERVSMALPEGRPGAGCVESLWLADRDALAACNRWRGRAGEPLLWVVEESGTPVLDWP